MVSAIEINNKHSHVNIISLYNNSDRKISSYEWVNFFNSFRGPTIIGGDFNSHNVAWGSGKTDSKGIDLLDAIHKQNLVILNDGKPTLLRRSDQIYESVIDLTLVTPELSCDFISTTLEDTLGSNHYPILLESNIFQLNSVFTSPLRKWNLKKANWSIFKAEMEKYTISVTGTEHYVSYEKFTENLELACIQAIPQVKFFNENQKYRKPWWSKTCEEMMLLRKDKLKNYKETPSINNFIEYQKADARCKRVCKEENRKAWVKFTNSLNRRTKISEIWNSVKRLKNRKVSNRVPLNRGPWTENLMNSLAPQYVLPYVESILNLSPKDHDDPLNNGFNMKELLSAIKPGLNTAPGSDNVHYPMIENLPKICKLQLLNIFNAIWKESKIPEIWREVVVVPSLKPEKSPESYSSYRPISLTSCFLKTFERMIKFRLDWWLERNNILPKSQYGFRKTKSIQEAQASLLFDIHQGFLEQKSTMAVFYDIIGAYNNIQIPILIQKMDRIHTPKRIRNIVFQIIKKRIIYLRINKDLLGPQHAFLGLGQGDILSCPLYSLYI